MQAIGGSGEVPFRPTLMVMEQGEHNSLDHNADSPAGKNIKKQRLASIVILV
jgi:hypothetical protein